MAAKPEFKPVRGEPFVANSILRVQLADTQRIAQEIGVAHPCYPSMRTPVVMTTDFLVTRRKAREFVDEARTVIPSRDLAKLRTLEKLEIERIYWTERGIDWGIVTEHECHPTLANNIELIHEPYSHAATTPLTPVELAEAVRLLIEIVEHSAEPLRRLTSECDRTLGQDAGTSLTIAYYLIATRQWLIDMYTPIDPTKPMVLRGVSLAR
jgi:hypothetical protein